MLDLEKGTKILFTGDSITDCGRDRKNISDLGVGYVRNIASWLLLECAELELAFVNTGISGDRAKDLVARWDADCIAHKPDIVSIFVGINDVWRKYDGNDPTSAEDYENNYRLILESCKRKLDCKIVIIEPFVLPVPDDRKKWREDLDPKIDVARRLAREFATVYVPLDGIFASASLRREPAYWAYDGVHPTIAGHMLIADAWLEKTALLR